MSQDNLSNDPVLNAAYNSALEWAANWITGSQMLGHGEEVVEFAKNMAMSIRAAKREVGFQQDFFEAIRLDPYMPIAEKEYWLSQEGGRTQRVLDDAEVCDCGEPFPESGSCRFCGARSRHRQ